MSSSNDGIRLRSAQWYAGDDRNAYLHRAWMRRGVPGVGFTGRPHTAIANTASDLTPCNAHLTEVAASVTVCTRPAASRRRCRWAKRYEAQLQTLHAASEVIAPG